MITEKRGGVMCARCIPTWILFLFQEVLDLQLPSLIITAQGRRLGSPHTLLDTAGMIQQSTQTKENIVDSPETDSLIKLLHINGPQFFFSEAKKYQKYNQLHGNIKQFNKVLKNFVRLPLFSHLLF